eukprot:3490189-Rhodomonas_salina.5
MRQPTLPNAGNAPGRARSLPAQPGRTGRRRPRRQSHVPCNSVAFFHACHRGYLGFDATRKVGARGLLQVARSLGDAELVDPEVVVGVGRALFLVRVEDNVAHPMVRALAAPDAASASRTAQHTLRKSRGIPGQSRRHQRCPSYGPDGCRCNATRRPQRSPSLQSGCTSHGRQCWLSPASSTAYQLLGAWPVSEPSTAANACYDTGNATFAFSLVPAVVIDQHADDRP